MKTFRFTAAIAAATVLIAATAAMADEPMLTKSAPMAYVPPSSATCGSAYDFFFSACPLTWYGVTVFGTVDMGVNYSTHGTPFDPNHPTGEAYLIGAGGTNAPNRLTGFFPGENGLSQSEIGIKIAEPIGGGWSFVGQFGVAFEPYSGLLANAPVAEFNSIGVPQNHQEAPFDSSRWGWLAASNYAGISSPIAGTLTFGRQNALGLDGNNAYDPMGGSYAFSVIGYSGKNGGGGDTENGRMTTLIKYRVNLGDGRFSAMVQPIGLFGGGSSGAGYNAFNANNGAVEVGIGGDIKHRVPGVISWDLIGTYEKDAVNWGTFFPGPASATNTQGWPTLFGAGGLKATLSNNLAGMALLKWSFGSWGDPAPIVGKGPVAPSGPTGIPLTLYAGYQLIQFSNPSDPVTSSFRDDGFMFNFVNAGATALSANGTTIANNAFNSQCGSGSGCTNEIFQVMWTGAKYGINKDLDIIGAYYHYIQNTFVINVNCSPSAASGNSRCDGWLDAYSLLLDWRFLPKWDAYIGTMYSAAYGGLANGDITRNNLSTTAGVRFRF
jgi:hypothetical protein